ncbi:hypothetical protein OG985_49215 (plasmid) [Streptomyces sp. NBC_00289]|uniref:hypothetical protein n=1 Tax=Streptomyces sp. NBC_00289 TaxID=2975703 RepID=UPI002F90ED5A
MADTDDGGVEEIEQAEELVARVAAIDIAKASGMVCVRVPHEDKPQTSGSRSRASQRPAWLSIRTTAARGLDI